MEIIKMENRKDSLIEYEKINLIEKLIFLKEYNYSNLRDYIKLKNNILIDISIKNKVRINKIIELIKELKILEKENKYFNKDFINIGDNEKEYFYYIKSIDNFKERDIIYNLIDYIELKYNINILKYSLEYKSFGVYFLVEKYKDN